MLEVRKARVDELDAVFDFYGQMADQMEDTDFDVQWRRGGHPSAALLRESVEAGQMIIGVPTGDAEGEGVEADACASGAGGAKGARPEGGKGAAGSHPVIASAMVVNHEGSPGYEAVPWAVDAAPECVGVLHVVATLPAYHGRGFARQLLTRGIEISRADGLAVLRLDTFPHNKRARSLYESCGFEDRGDWTVYYPALGDIQVSMYELPL